MHAWWHKAHFYGSAATIYALTLAFAWFVLQPVSHPSHPVVLARSMQQPRAPLVPQISTIAGLPMRIVIPDSGVDLPVDPGYYDSTTGEWTLSGYRAQFAMISTLANNLTGETFIYGHNNNYVFGALRHHTPVVGSTALIYTNNNHIFQYSFQAVTSVSPDDTNVLNYDGPPRLTIQTCTGSLNEWRTMYNYSFEKVVQ